jgi:hypothetical protein
VIRALLMICFLIFGCGPYIHKSNNFEIVGPESNRGDSLSILLNLRPSCNLRSILWLFWWEACSDPYRVDIRALVGGDTNSAKEIFFSSVSVHHGEKETELIQKDMPPLIIPFSTCSNGVKCVGESFKIDSNFKYVENDTVRVNASLKVLPIDSVIIIQKTFKAVRKNGKGLFIYKI